MTPDRTTASALLFLTLCAAWGPDRACFVIMVVALVAAWIWLCGRYPVIAWITVGFLRGLFGR